MTPCHTCQDKVPARTERHTILADLCDACVLSAKDDAGQIFASVRAFAEKYHHSPEFVREFADFVLRSSQAG